MGKKLTQLKGTRSRLKISRCRYKSFFARSDNEHALQTIWAVHAIQSGHAELAKPFLLFPKEAVVTSMTQPNSIYKWELETFITSLLITPKDRLRKGRHRISNLNEFGSILRLACLLRDIEDCEYALMSRAEEIFEEMYRIGHRQFSWQRGAKREQFFRYTYVYGQGKCGKYFQDKYDLSVQDFMLMGLLICEQVLGRPWTCMPDLTNSSFSQDDLDKTLAILSIDVVGARLRATQLNRDMTQKLGCPLRTAYMPSLMRRFPLFKRTSPRETDYIAPLPPLVLSRVTAGLYYDFMAAPQQVLEEANRRFEEYIQKLLAAYHERVDTFSGKRYGPKGHQFDPPDCLVKHGKAIVLVIECKATKLTFEAQFAEDPMGAAKQGFEQMAKAVFQLWRFFSHARLGRYNEHSVSETAIGIILTMDAWMQTAGDLRVRVVNRARELAANQPEIEDEDKREVVFCSVEELNGVCAEVEFDGLLEIMRHAVTPKYHGWGVREVMRDCGVQRTAKEFPMRFDELVPWLKITKDPTNGSV